MNQTPLLAEFSTFQQKFQGEINNNCDQMKKVILSRESLIYSRGMHLLSKNIINNPVFGFSSTALRLRTHQFTLNPAYNFSDLKPQKNSEILTFFEDILKKYQLRTASRREKQSAEERAMQKFVETLNKISSFKGNKRLSYQHKLDDLLQICSQNFPKLSVQDKTAILTILSSKIEFNILSKKLILDLMNNLQQLSFKNKFELLFYTSNYEKIHSPIYLDSDSLKCISRGQVTPIIKNLLNELEEELQCPFIEIFQRNQVLFKRMENVVYIWENQIEYILRNLKGLKIGHVKIIKKIVQKVLIPYASKFSLEEIFKIIEALSHTHENLSEYLSADEWHILMMQIQNKKQQMSDPQVCRYLSKGLLRMQRIQQIDEIRNYNGLILYTIEQIIQNQKNIHDSKIYSFRILHLLLKVTSKDKSLKMRATVQKILKQYLYYLISEVKNSNYGAKTLIMILLAINDHRKHKIFSLSNNQIRNTIIIICEELWLKVNFILNQPKKNEFFIRKLHFLINQKDLNRKFTKSRQKIEQLPDDDICSEYNRQLRSRSHYLIEHIPEEICRKILALMEQFKKLDEQ